MFSNLFVLLGEGRKFIDLWKLKLTKCKMDKNLNPPLHVFVVVVPLVHPTKENPLVLIAVGIGGKITEEQDQIRI